MTREEHHQKAEQQLAEAEALYDIDNRELQVNDAIYARIAHLRQCAIAHALLSK